MKTPVKLVYAEVKALALKAYQEGRLSAQSPVPSCRYRDDDGHPCAVGVALDDVTARKFDGTGMSVYGLHGCGKIECDDLPALIQLQSAHDAWANCPDNAARAKGFADLVGAPA